MSTLSESEIAEIRRMPDTRNQGLALAASILTLHVDGFEKEARTKTGFRADLARAARDLVSDIREQISSLILPPEPFHFSGEIHVPAVAHVLAGDETERHWLIVGGDGIARMLLIAVAVEPKWADAADIFVTERFRTDSGLHALPAAPSEETRTRQEIECKRMLRMNTPEMQPGVQDHGHH